MKSVVKRGVETAVNELAVSTEVWDVFKGLVLTNENQREAVSPKRERGWLADWRIVFGTAAFLYLDVPRAGCEAGVERLSTTLTSRAGTISLENICDKNQK